MYKPVITGSEYANFVVWDDNGNILDKIDSTIQGIYSIKMISETDFATSSDSTIKLWKLGSPVSLIVEFEWHPSIVLTLETCDGQFNFTFKLIKNAKLGSKFKNRTENDI